jgi:hypothetical protein
VRDDAAATFRIAIDTDTKISLYNSYTSEQFGHIFCAQIRAAYIYGNFLKGRKLKKFNKALREYEQWGMNLFIGRAHTSDGVYALTLAHEGRDIGEEFKEHMMKLYGFAHYR